MNNKKSYTTPEVEVEKFTIYCGMAISDPLGLEGTGSEFVGGDDWEF